jgi:hypothetical protein
MDPRAAILDAAARAPPPAPRPELSLDETLAFLGSAAALASLDEDPYWPKWDGPWWRMMLLYEMGLAARIPRACVERLVARMKVHYLTFFPLRIEELPPGKDMLRNVSCHCQLGTGYRLLSACGVDVDAELPWIRPWFLKYQLPDGGLNCDEAAYTRPEPHSSIVSTLPPLEAVLSCAALSPEEERFLDRGAEYLLARRLFRSARTGEVIGGGPASPAPSDVRRPKKGAIGERWTRLSFPRFYQYDLLRGLTFLAGWAERRGRTLPADAIAEAVARVVPEPRRRVFDDETRTLRGPDWGARQPATTFPLLERASAEDAWLRNEWRETALRLARRI